MSFCLFETGGAVLSNGGCSNTMTGWERGGTPISLTPLALQPKWYLAAIASFGTLRDAE